MVSRSFFYRMVMYGKTGFFLAFFIILIQNIAHLRRLIPDPMGIDIERISCHRLKRPGVDFPEIGAGLSPTHQSRRSRTA